MCRRRSSGWTKAKTDVVIAFWGFNESFQGYDGIEKFKAELDKYLKDLKAAKFNGTSAPRVVLFSPIAEEKMADPNLPGPDREQHESAELHRRDGRGGEGERRAVRRSLTPSRRSCTRTRKQPLTHNGIHLTVAGYHALAPVIYKAIFGAEPPADDAALEKIRDAVRVKNDMWLSRYRTVDQFNIFGGRSTIGYESGKGGPKVDNRYVLWPELAVRDVMTENREKRVWALAQGKRSEDRRLQCAASAEDRHQQARPESGRLLHLHQRRRGDQAHDGAERREDSSWSRARSSSRNSSARCRWLGTPKAGSGFPPGRTTPSGRRGAKKATSC